MCEGTLAAQQVPLPAVSWERFLFTPEGQESLCSRENETESAVKEGEAYQRKEIGIYQDDAFSLDPKMFQIPHSLY